MVPTSYYIFLAAVVFSIGTAGVLIRRNVIVIFMSIELMLNAVNLAFVAFSRQFQSMDGQAIVVLRHDRGGGRGRRRAGDHHRHVPQPRDA